VRRYWICVSVLVLGVAGSFAAAALRGGTKSLAWHVFMAIVGLVVAVAFSVTETGPAGVSPASPQGPVHGCYSNI
jgi:hypothetical protein